MFRHTRYVMAAPGVDPLDPISDHPKRRLSMPVLFFIGLVVIASLWAVVGSLTSGSAQAASLPVVTLVKVSPTLTTTTTPTQLTRTPGIECQVTPVYVTVQVPKMVERLVESTRLVPYAVVQTKVVIQTVEVTRIVIVTATHTSTPTASPTPTASATSAASITAPPSQTPWIVIITLIPTSTPTSTPSSTQTSTPTPSPSPSATITPTP